MDQATEQLHVMTVVGGDALLQFRGRIFHPEEGYEPRTLLELRIRKGIGAILNKPRWWHKWRQAGGDAEGASLIRDKWLAEIERDILNDTVEWSTRDWNHWELSEKVAARFQRYPTDGTDEERRRFIDECCATVPFHLIWCPELWENDEEDLEAEQIHEHRAWPMAWLRRTTRTQAKHLDGCERDHQASPPVPS